MHTLYRGSEAAPPAHRSLPLQTPQLPPLQSPISQPVPCWAFPKDEAPKGVGKLMCLKMNTQQKHCKVQMGAGLLKVLRDQEKSPVRVAKVSLNHS